MTPSPSFPPITPPPRDPPALAPPAVAMRAISKRFGSVVANDQVDFEASWGEVHALVGENGAGKSTLMSILAGLYRPDSGQVEIDGKPVRFRSPRHAIAHGIGMVYQHFMLVEPFTVVENVVLGEQRSGVDLQTARVERELTELSQRYGLDVDPRAKIWQLSVGEQQRVEILRLLYLGARILVLDEPTAVLTPQEAAAGPPAPTSMRPVGRYAYQIVWNDGHDTGIYPLELLRSPGEIHEPASPPQALAPRRQARRRRRQR